MHVCIDAYRKEAGKHLVVHRCCSARVIMKMTFFAMNGTQRAAGGGDHRRSEVTRRSACPGTHTFITVLPTGRTHQVHYGRGYLVVSLPPRASIAPVCFQGRLKG